MDIQQQADACLLFHIDDCMYVAALSEADAIAHVHAECGPDCGDPEWVKRTSLDMPVTRADVDEGEEVTPESMTTARVMLEEHLRNGGTLPHTVCYDSGM